MSSILEVKGGVPLDLVCHVEIQSPVREVFETLNPLSPRSRYARMGWKCSVQAGQPPRVIIEPPHAEELPMAMDVLALVPLQSLQIRRSCADGMPVDRIMYVNDRYDLRALGRGHTKLELTARATLRPGLLYADVQATNRSFREQVQTDLAQLLVLLEEGEQAALDARMNMQYTDAIDLRDVA